MKKKKKAGRPVGRATNNDKATEHFGSKFSEGEEAWLYELWEASNLTQRKMILLMAECWVANGCPQ